MNLTNRMSSYTFKKSPEFIDNYFRMLDAIFLLQVFEGFDKEPVVPTIITRLVRSSLTNCTSKDRSIILYPDIRKLSKLEIQDKHCVDQIVIHLARQVVTLQQHASALTQRDAE